jgi:propanol-preferring alcohol dehydrogenase
MGIRVIAIDGGEQKRSLCLDTLGAEAFIDFTQVDDVAAEVIRITDGKGAHGIFVTAGNKAAYESAPKMVRVGGRVMCIGLGELGASAFKNHD